MALFLFLSDGHVFYYILGILNRRVFLVSYWLLTLRTFRFLPLPTT